MPFVLRRLVQLLLTLLLISILVFFAFQIIPGDPALLMLGMDATPEAYEALRIELGLDQPAILRYFTWMGQLFRGDFGTSYAHGDPVGSLLAGRLQITGALMLLSFFITVALSLPLGLLRAGRQRGVVHWVITTTAQFSMAIPPVFLGLLLTFLFGFVFSLFSPAQFVHPADDILGFWAYLTVPAFAIAIPKSAMTIRLIRRSVQQELGQDYVRTAKSRGASPRRVLYCHILPNIMVPLLTFLALSFIMILTDTLIIEQLFNIPGAGRLLLAAIGSRDYPIVSVLVLLIALFVTSLHAMVDFLAGIIDPRIGR